jgi:hypothetical protein
MMRLRQRQLIHVGLWTLVLVLGARFARFTVSAAVRPSNGFAAYYTASRLVKEGVDVSRFYDDAWFRAEIAEYGPDVNDIYNLNPPTTALLLLPLAGLDYTAARIAWTFFNLMCLTGAVGWLMQQTGFRGLWIPGFIAFALLYQPVYANFSQGQAYVLMLVLLAMAWHGYRHRRAWVLGIALGLMLVLKTAGVLLWLLLLVQGRWRALAWGAASALIVGLVTLPGLGLNAWRTYFHLLPGLSARPELAVTAYQTLPGFVRHLLVFDERWNPAPLFHAPALANWLVGLGFVVMAGLSTYRAHITDRADLIFAAFASANVILSPVSLDYHYALLLVPIVILMAWVREQAVAWPGIVLAAAMLLLAADLPYRAPQLAAGAWALLTYPTLYGAWLLWGLALWACHWEQSGP